jgi:hypothetical protein
VVAHGAGHVGKSFADSITTPLVVRNFLEQKINMMEPAVRESQDSRKKTTVLEDIVVIVENGGSIIFLHNSK